jgi:hypothetical protein
MGNNKKFFTRWNYEAKNFKIIKRCKMTADLFESLHMIIDSNFKNSV